MAKANAGQAPAISPVRGPAASAARERILGAAYDLFSHQGVRAVGVDTIIARAEVAKMTFYRHFPSKSDLVLAFLERRQELWTERWLEAETKKRASDPRRRLLAIFDVLDEWFHRADFEGCSFINTQVETVDSADPVRVAVRSYTANIRGFVQELADVAGVPQPDAFARKWQILMAGAIVAAGDGDSLAARRAQAMGRLLLDSALAPFPLREG
jgi:AcrR family transcriptional regulator